MTVFVVFPAGRTTSVYHTDPECPTFKPNTYVRETEKETAIERYDAELCARCAEETVYIKRHHVSTFHAEKDCKYLTQAESPREIAKETAQGFFEAEPCENCSKQANDHSYYNAAVQAGRDN